MLKSNSRISNIGFQFAAILLAPELISSYFQGPFIVDGRWLVILTTVALGTLGAVFGDAQARAAALPR